MIANITTHVISVGGNGFTKYVTVFEIKAHMSANAVRRLSNLGSA